VDSVTGRWIILATPIRRGRKRKREKGEEKVEKDENGVRFHLLFMVFAVIQKLLNGQIEKSSKHRRAVRRNR